MELVAKKESKVCRKCGVELSVPDNWTKGRRGRNDCRCRTCESNRRREYYLDNKDAHRNRVYKSLYGITLDDYDEMLANQDFSCGCCGVHHTEDRRKLCVDHDHHTGEVRGLLCDKCNTALGKLGDNLDGVMNLVNYLKRNENCQLSKVSDG